MIVEQKSEETVAGLDTEAIMLGRDDYRDKVHACWLGKNIGGTLGAPYEGRDHVHSLQYYDPIPDKADGNDDLDLQLVWLTMLERRGVPPKLPHFAEFWSKYLCAYPPDEYGFCIRNLDRGLMPPVSGWFENYFVDCMGAPIRSEIWACLAPASPQRAAALAWMDAAMDHAGGEGMNGEMFWAAIESAAFVERDVRKLIRIGLAMIPPSCRLARAVREILWCWDHNRSWAEARDRVQRCFPGAFAMDAPQNHAFVIIGWLYGKDFGDKLCTAVNCGCDTDCTGATLGAILGILGGTAGIPEVWREPIGDAIVLNKFTQGENLPKTLEELTVRTVSLAEEYGAVQFGEETAVPDAARLRLGANDEARAAREQDICCAHQLADDGRTEVVLHYHAEPVLRPGIPQPVSVSTIPGASLHNGNVSLKAPQAWSVRRIGSDRFEISADAPEAVNRLDVVLCTDAGSATASFVLLGPEEARGVPGLIGVERCPACRAVRNHCICPAGPNKE